MSACKEKIPLWRVLLLFFICVLTHYLYLYSRVFQGLKTASIFRVFEGDVKAIWGDKYGSVSYYVKIVKENQERNKGDRHIQKSPEQPVIVPNVSSFSGRSKSVSKTTFPSNDIAVSEEILLKGFRDRIVKNESEPLLTIFTTWNVSDDKSLVHNLTMNNWITLYPFAIPVIFTNDPAIAEECFQRGWKVLPIRVEAAGGVPVLKYMYQDVMATYNTTFYAYSNSDILYTKTLVVTLVSLLNSAVNLEKPTLIVGKRTNIKFITILEGSSWKNLTSVAKTRGNVFAGNAQDYFITTRIYPWLGIPEVVIGRRAYDNWLVYQARKNKHNVIDVTETVLAVHQTTSAGNLEGHTHTNKDYNYKLLRKFDRKIKYLAGTIDCVEHYTKYEQGSIVVANRSVHKGQCKT